jgi:hypothetical protein
VVCIQTGAWPARLHDVQETGDMLMKEQQDKQQLEKENV